MKKLIIALLVAALCMVAPAVAVEWGDLPTDMMVMIDCSYPPGESEGTYFDVYLDDDNDMEPETVYPGWCVQSGVPAIKNRPYSADLSSTIGESDDWNKVNWVLNNKGSASYGQIQAAIWKILRWDIPPQYRNWDDPVAQSLTNSAEPDYIPGPGDIGAVLVVANRMTGQDVVIEVPIPCETPTPTPTPPPVPEFPTMMIPVFLVGSVMVAASVLKKE